MHLQFGHNSMSLAEPRVMGILNVTEDSFSDGGRFIKFDDALRQASRMVDEGASIIDVGGESTRPGAGTVSEQVEIDRVAPVIEAISGRMNVIVSVDTSKASVMKAAVSAGAAMINDVYALRRDDALETAVGLNVVVCLMHMQGKPETMQQRPEYDDVTSEVVAFLASRIQECADQGISPGKLCIDPGFGFGKTDDHNLLLLRNLGALCSLAVPIVVGLSRKQTLGHIAGKDAAARATAGIAAAVLAVSNGARIVRTHDVGVTVDALKMVEAVRRAD